jgi:50S ribosomal protein L16 3-hydroxylase
MRLRALPGGMDARDFLARYWQKRPLLVRGAFPAFAEPITVRALLQLAQRDDCEARIVARSGARWRLMHGPFRAAELRRPPQRDWTILVQGLNHFVPPADRLMRLFDFVPYARLDDVMASYAVAGGGVGPHFDSYDVFLVQGRGRRRWRISRQRDLALDPRAPLKVLRDFQPTQEWVLEPGDMLYLPPNVAHEGTALEPCVTYSIGFRAPTERELASEFLAFLQDQSAFAERRYADPGLRPVTRPAAIDAGLVARCTHMIEHAVRWTRADIRHFLGRYLSEPKPHVRFTPPAPSLPRRAFERACSRAGVRLAAATGLLYRGGDFFINGEQVRAGGAARRAIERLADDRALPPRTRLTRAAAALLYNWYRAGYLEPDTGGAHG